MTTPVQLTYPGATVDTLLETVNGSNLSATHKITRSATLVVAASDSSAKSKAQADYVCDGVNDHAEILDAIGVILDTGGVLVLTDGTFNCPGQFVLANDGATPPKQKPLVIRGSGASMSGRGTGVFGGTVLNMTFDGDYGKLVTSGLGLLDISGVTFTDTGGSDTPWIYTTNTTLHVHSNAFIGSKSGVNCDQDAIILGGTTQVEGHGGLDDGFQGYGTIIQNNYFDHIRRAVYGRVFANGVVVRDNTIWNNSGSNLVDGAAIEFSNVAETPSQSDAGNLIIGNLIEIMNYPYGIKLGVANQNSIIHNNMYDSTAVSLAAVRLESSATQNIIIDGMIPGGVTSVSDANGRNQHISIDMGVESKFTEPVLFSNNAKINTLKITNETGAAYGGVFVVQPDVVSTGGTKLINVKRSSAETTAPDETIWSVGYDGSIVQGSNASCGGNYIGPYCNYTAGGRKWSAVGTLPGQTDGAEMTIDSGPGGSYLVLRNYGVKFHAHGTNGVLRAIIGGGADQIRFGPNGLTDIGIIAGTGSPEGAITAPVGSLYLRRDGGAGTSIYIKETGSENTGWVAK